jgi:hypothetical protein
MIYIYGDSHGIFSFKNLQIQHVNKSSPSITMFRIGRDNKIIYFDNKYHDKNSIICFCYGEVDCRCHIKKQINLGRNENDIIFELVGKYFNTIIKNIRYYKRIVVVGIIPTRCQSEYETTNEEITHEYPFVGTDEERIRFTNKVNFLLKTYCDKYNFIYFNPYYHYSDKNGVLKTELSDGNVHLGENSYFLQAFTLLLSKM